jgi:hypothetical protein
MACFHGVDASALCLSLVQMRYCTIPFISLSRQRKLFCQHLRTFFFCKKISEQSIHLHVFMVYNFLLFAFLLYKCDIAQYCLSLSRQRALFYQHLRTIFFCKKISEPSIHLHVFMVYTLLLYAFLLYKCVIAQYRLYLSQDKGHCFINIFEHSSFVRKYLNHPYSCMFSLCTSFCSLPFSCTDAILHNTVYISLTTKGIDTLLL